LGWRITGRGLLGDVAGAIVAAIVATTSNLSFAALLFPAALVAARPQGLVMMMVGTGFVGGAFALGGSLPFVAAGPDANTIAVLADLSRAIVSEAGPGADPAMVAERVRAAVMLGSVLTGVALLALGLARAGRAVRFLPFPVIAGFLSATGWITAAGGVVVGAGVPVMIDQLPAFLDPSVDARLAATLGTGILLLVATERLRHPAVMPGGLAIAVVLHHAAFRLAGMDPAQARAAGWLIRMPDALRWSFPWTRRMVSGETLARLAPHLGELVALAIVAAIATLVNMTALEAATGQDADLDRDLAAGGAGALAAGLFGGALGAVITGRCVTLRACGATSRLAPLLTAAIAALGPALAPGALQLLPTPVLGALLVQIGAALMLNWTWRTRRQLGLGEWLTVLAIFALAVRLGFVTAIFAGLLVSCALFAFRYGRVPAVRLSYGGEVAESTVERGGEDRARLRAEAGRLLVMHLQGYLFFGSADALARAIRARLEGPEAVRFVVLDLTRVTGVDGSAAQTLARLGQRARQNGATLALSAVPHGAPPVLGVAGVSYASADDAIEAWEESVLGEEAARRGEPAVGVRGLLLGGDLDAEIDVAALAPVLDRLQRFDLAPGDPLVRQGEASDAVWFVESGRVAVRVAVPGNGSVRVRQLGQGAMVGEIGFYLGQARNATVTAETDARVWRLTRETLAELERAAPALGARLHAAMAYRLSDRLRDRDRFIAALLRG
jgi:SulP family sulfate permease